MTKTNMDLSEILANHDQGDFLRDVEDLLAERGVTVSYETIRDWVNRFGHGFAAKIRRDRPAPADKWHLDEVVIAPSCNVRQTGSQFSSTQSQTRIWATIL